MFFNEILYTDRANTVQMKKGSKSKTLEAFAITSGLDGTRTRDPLRDRQVF